MTLEEREKRLTMLEDLQAIRDMHHEYIFRLNNRQWDEIIEMFTEDATANIGHHGLRTGKAEVAKLFKERISQINAEGRRDAHNAIDPVITVNGNKAEGHWLMYIFIADPETGLARMFTQGRHDCEYEKVDGKWMFKSVKYTRPWPLEPDSVPKD